MGGRALLLLSRGLSSGELVVSELPPWGVSPANVLEPPREENGTPTSVSGKEDEAVVGLCRAALPVREADQRAQPGLLLALGSLGAFPGGASGQGS